MRKTIGIFCLVLGIILVLYPQFEKKVEGSRQKELIQAFENLGNLDVNEGATLPVQGSDNEGIQNLLAGARGVVRIPKIDLKMLIVEGASEESLIKGIGMIEPKKEFGVNNVGLAGHRSTTYGKQFNRLDELVANDLVEIETKAGTYRFVVAKTFVVDRNQVEVLKDEQEPILTLVTCTPVGQSNPTERLIVQAKLANKK